MISRQRDALSFFTNGQKTKNNCSPSTHNHRGEGARPPQKNRTRDQGEGQRGAPKNPVRSSRGHKTSGKKRIGSRGERAPALKNRGGGSLKGIGKCRSLSKRGGHLRKWSRLRHGLARMGTRGMCAGTCACSGNGIRKTELPTGYLVMTRDTDPTGYRVKRQESRGGKTGRKTRGSVSPGKGAGRSRTSSSEDWVVELTSFRM